MPLPFVSLIPKPAEGTKFTRILNIIFYASLALILASLLIFFLLNNVVKKSTQFLEEQEKTLISQRTPEQLASEKNVLSFKQKIRDFEFLFGQHRFLSNAFTFLEKLTHPKVWFAVFQLNPQAGQIVLTGQADNFRVLGEQLLILKNDAKIKELNLSGATINPQGKIDFNLRITLDPQVFSYQSPEIKEEIK